MNFCVIQLFELCSIGFGTVLIPRLAGAIQNNQLVTTPEYNKKVKTRALIA